MRRSVFILVLCLGYMFSIPSDCFAQNKKEEELRLQKKIDSVLTVLKIVKEDTLKVCALKVLGTYFSEDDPDSAKKYIDASFKLAAKLNYKKGVYEGYYWRAYLEDQNENIDEALSLYEKAYEASRIASDTNIFTACLNRLGVLNKEKGLYTKALEYYNTALKVHEATKNKKFIAVCYGNIGVVYISQGNYPKALEYDLIVLKAFEELDFKPGISLALGNIGGVYAAQHNNEKALEFYTRALKMQEALGNARGIARNLANIGVIYLNLGDHDKALEYYFKALKISEGSENKSEIANYMGNIGLAYESQATKKLRGSGSYKGTEILYRKALEYYFKALKIDEELGIPASIASKLGNIGSLYQVQKKHVLAEEYLLKALKISDEIGAKDLQKDHHQFLSELYTSKGDHKKAYHHFKIFTSLRFPF